MAAAGALMSWVEASCLPGSASSSHLCPFVLQVFRRADKNGELWLPLGQQCGEGWETSGRLRGVWDLGVQSRMEKNLGETQIRKITQGILPRGSAVWS